jgi:dTDP-4-dehydrorhamnose reductase
MRILITGARGQLGTALIHALHDHELITVDLPEFDITDGTSVQETFERECPEIVIHCAAYTDVDGSARDPALAYRVNALGTKHVALACQAVGATLAHISTNEVFPGDRTTGYEEWMPLGPRNSYGVSKAAAETHISELLSHFYIIRTAWLFAPGGRNFIHSILRRAMEKGEVRVVTDEVANPTSAVDLAEAIRALIVTGQYGIYHLVNYGACSRWAFAREILQQAGMLPAVANVPILSSDYPRPSRPPAFSALINRNGAAIGIHMRPWQEALADYMRSHPIS